MREAMTYDPRCAEGDDEQRSDEISQRLIQDEEVGLTSFGPEMSKDDHDQSVTKHPNAPCGPVDNHRHQVTARQPV